jgi:hypothetical protein
MGLQLSGSVQLEGNLLVTGSANSVFENISVTNRITANEINVQFVSSSIIYSSGSNRFGDEAGDKHQFTGSVDVSGDLSLIGAQTGDVTTYINITRGSNLGFQVYDNPQDNASTIHSAGTMNFRASGSNRVSIDNNNVRILTGNLGVGVIPNTWAGTNTKALQVYLGSMAASLTFGTAFTFNSHYDGNWRYIGSYNAGKYEIGGDEHIWYSAPSGTAGDTISFVETMKLTTDGYLGVGKNSTAVSNGDLIGLLAFKSNDVSTNSAGAIASIRSYATGDYNTGNVEGDMRFYVSNGSAPNGSFLSGNEAGRFTKDRFFKAGPGSFENAAGAPHEFTSDINDSKVVTFRHSGNSTPYGLQINFTDAAPNDATRWIISAGDSSTIRFKVNSDGGVVNYQSNNVDLSDERVKSDITPLGSSWNEVKQYEIVSYKYTDQTHNDLNIGVIAQQIELVNPNLVDNGILESESGDALKTVYNKDIYFTAIKALQEAMIRIEQLETKVAQLQNN